MKALCMLAIGALCAFASAYGQTSRLREFYKYDDPIVPEQDVALEPLVILVEKEKNVRPPREIREDDILIDIPTNELRISEKLSIAGDDDAIDLPDFDTEGRQSDALPQRLIRAYKGGFKVNMPIIEEEMTMYINSGFRWKLGKGRFFSERYLTLPYVSRYIGFRFKARY